MSYKIWRAMYRESYCVIEPPEIDDEWQLDEGISRAADHPEDVQCVMDPEFPYDIQLADNLYGAGVPIVSSGIKQFLEGEVRQNRVEYLPVQIVNHKGRVAAEEYFILHPLDVCDCIDIERSGVEWNSITSGLITACGGLVLKDGAIPEDFKLFRPKFWGVNILVRNDLVASLSARRFVGLYFLEAEGYTGMG